MLEKKAEYSHLVTCLCFLFPLQVVLIILILNHSQQHGVFIELLQRGSGGGQVVLYKRGGEFLSKSTFSPNSQWLPHSSAGLPAEGQSCFLVVQASTSLPTTVCSAHCRHLQTGLLSSIYMGLLPKLLNSIRAEYSCFATKKPEHAIRYLPPAKPGRLPAHFKSLALSRKATRTHVHHGLLGVILRANADLRNWKHWIPDPHSKASSFQEKALQTWSLCSLPTQSNRGHLLNPVQALSH